MPQLSVDVRFRRANGFALDVKLLTSEGVAALSGPSGSGKSTLLHLNDQEVFSREVAGDLIDGQISPG